MLLPAVLAGATSAVLISAMQPPDRSHVVQQRTPQSERDLGLRGQLPQPAPQILDHAGDPRALATGAGPPVPMPTGPLGIPGPALTAYVSAANHLADTNSRCGVDWSVLASIGRIESDHARSGKLDAGGTTTRAVLGPRLDGNGVAPVPDTDRGALDGDPTWDRAVGPMQLLPSMWERYGGSASGAGSGSPHNIGDAAMATGKILCSSGGDLRDPRNLASAVFAYNHSDDYVRTVLVWAAAYANGVMPTPVDQSPGSGDPLAGERVPESPVPESQGTGSPEWPVPVQPGPGIPPSQALEWADPVDPGTSSSQPVPPSTQPPNSQPPSSQPPSTQPPSTQPPQSGAPPSDPQQPSPEPSSPEPSSPQQPSEPSPPESSKPEEPSIEPSEPMFDQPQPGIPQPGEPSRPAPAGASPQPSDEPPRPSTSSPATGLSPSTEPPNTEPPNTEPANTGSPSTEQPSTEQPSTEQPSGTSGSADPGNADLHLRPCDESVLAQGKFRTQEGLPVDGTSPGPGTTNPSAATPGKIVYASGLDAPEPCVVPRDGQPPG